MADTGIKKIRILQKDLPAINADTEGYSFRYRVVSDDRNRSSHWSPIVTLSTDYTYTSGSISFNKNGSIAQQAWDSVTISKNGNVIRQAHEYDIWVKWDRNDGGDWIYKQRIDGTNISFPIPSTYTIGGVVQGSAPNKLTTEVYLKGDPISRNSSFLLVYTDGPHTI
jgi:hypothetical protein